MHCRERKVELENRISVQNNLFFSIHCGAPIQKEEETCNPI